MNLQDKMIQVYQNYMDECLVKQAECSRIRNAATYALRLKQNLLEKQANYGTTLEDLTTVYNAANGILRTKTAGLQEANSALGDLNAVRDAAVTILQQRLAPNQ